MCSLTAFEAETPTAALIGKDLVIWDSAWKRFLYPKHSWFVFSKARKRFPYTTFRQIQKYYERPSFQVLVRSTEAFPVCIEHSVHSYICHGFSKNFPYDSFLEEKFLKTVTKDGSAGKRLESPLQVGSNVEPGFSGSWLLVFAFSSSTLRKWLEATNASQRQIEILLMTFVILFKNCVFAAGHFP